MQVAGRYSGAVDWIWVVTTKGVKSRWVILTPTPLNGSAAYKLSPIEANTLRLNRYADYILASAVCSGRGDIEWKYGNEQFIAQLMRAFEKFVINEEGSTFMDLVFSEDPSVGSWSFGTETLELVSFVAGIANTNKVPGLTYERVKASAKEAFTSSFRRTLGLKRIKTYEEVIKVYDTSWMYDAHGKKIKDYRLITSNDEFDALMKELEELNPPICSVDTETTGLKFYAYPGMEDVRSQICGMSVSWKLDQGIYIVFKSTKIGCTDVGYALARIIPWLNKRKHLITHNGLFDAKVFYSLGYRLNITDDTLLQAFSLDSTVSRGDKGLKVLTRKYYNHNTLELEDILGSNFNAELVPDIDPRLIELYACADTDYTLRLYFTQAEQIAALDRRAYTFDVSLYEILVPAEYHGSRLDMDRLKLLAEINRRDLEVLEALMHKYIRVMGTYTWAVRGLREAYFDSLCADGVAPDLAREKADAYSPAREDIDLVLQNAEFQDNMQRILQKQTKHGGQLEFTGKDILHIMYQILQYPITRINPEKGTWLCNEESLADLLQEEAEEPVPFLKQDVVSYIQETPLAALGNDKLILSKAKFESYKYPFAYMLKVWRKLDKFRTSFFNKLLDENTNGWYYTDYSMTSAETTRVINSIQTLEGSLKQVIVPYSKDYYMIVFDMAQIEFRVMLGLANEYWKQFVSRVPDPLQLAPQSRLLDGLIQKLCDPETDYHREGGSIFVGCTPEDMTKEQRHSVKAVHFSVPYGAGAFSIAEDRMRKAKSQRERDDILRDTQITLSMWQKKLFSLYYYLEHMRDVACTPCSENQLPVLLRKPEFDPNGNPYIGSNGKPIVHRPYGQVLNPMGQVRYFCLQDTSMRRTESIRRMAGNFPIQSFARDIFFTAIRRLYLRLKREGLLGGTPGTEKVFIHNFVHDEATLQVHKSIHPYQMYQYILEECLIQLKGYPFFYMGVSVVDNWYEGKDDKYEAPVRFVYQKANEYKANPQAFSQDNFWDKSPKEFVLEGISEYMSGRYAREVTRLQNQTENPLVINEQQLVSHFKNYFLKPRAYLYNEGYKFTVETGKGLDKSERGLLSHLVQYIHDADPEMFDAYMLDVDGVNMPLRNVCIIPEPKDLDLDLEASDDLDLEVSVDPYFDVDELAELNLDATPSEEFFNQDLTDAMEDYEDQESQAVDFYVASVDKVKSVRVFLQAIDPDADVDSEDAEGDTDASGTSSPTFVFEGPDSEYIVRIEGMTQQGFANLVTYLKQFRVTGGHKLYFWRNGQLVYSGATIDSTFSRDKVNEIVQSDLVSQAGRTQNFK